MIKLQDLTPSIYYNDSRDFQFMGRLYDIVLNHIKTNADNLYNLPIGKNMNEKLLNLLSLTLGFKARHNYNSTQLEAICSVLPLILRNKGSLNAVIIAVTALAHAEGIRQALDYYVDPKKSITLYLPEQLTDLSLLQDLLVYILPAGIGCRMVKEISETHVIVTEISTWDEVNVYTDNGYGTTKLGRLLRLRNESEVNDLVSGAPGTKIGISANAVIGKGNLMNPGIGLDDSDD